MGHAPSNPAPMWREDANGCWIWQWRAHRFGYGVKNVLLPSGRRTTMTAHRWLYTERIGPIPDGYQLHHCCGVPACVNPEHMEPLHPTEHIRLNGKLNHTLAAQIRWLVSEGWRRSDMGNAYDVTAQHVTTIMKGKAWA